MSDQQPKNEAACGGSALTAELDRVLPCPFCGGSDIRFTRHPGEGRGLHSGEDVWSTCCYQCGATFPNRYKKQLLVDQWNRRPNADLEDEVEGWEEQVSEAEADASAAWDRSNECECETAEKLDHIRACFESLVCHSGLDEDNPELLALGNAIAK